VVIVLSMSVAGPLQVPPPVGEREDHAVGPGAPTCVDREVFSANEVFSITTSRVRIYDDFSRLLFLHGHRVASALSHELPEESDQFRFLRAACLDNIKGSVGLILAKTSAMRISIPLDLSSRPFIPLPSFIRSSRVPPLLAPSLVFSPRRST